MDAAYTDTILEKTGQRLRLIDRSGKVLVDLSGPSLDGAVREGLIDPASLHLSLFAYATLKREVDELDRRKAEKNDRAFLASLNIRWD